MLGKENEFAFGEIGDVGSKLASRIELFFFCFGATELFFVWSMTTSVIVASISVSCVSSFKLMFGFVTGFSDKQTK